MANYVFGLGCRRFVSRIQVNDHFADVLCLDLAPGGKAKSISAPPNAARVLRRLEIDMGFAPYLSKIFRMGICLTSRACEDRNSAVCEIQLKFGRNARFV